MKLSIVLVAMLFILLFALLSTSLVGCAHCTRFVTHMHSEVHVGKSGVHITSYPESVCTEWSDK